MFDPQNIAYNLQQCIERREQDQKLDIQLIAGTKDLPVASSDPGQFDFDFDLIIEETFYFWLAGSDQVWND